LVENCDFSYTPLHSTPSLGGSLPIGVVGIAVSFGRRTVLQVISEGMTNYVHAAFLSLQYSANVAGFHLH